MSAPLRFVSGGTGPEGHLDELRSDPIALMTRVRAECGDVGAFRLADRNIALVSGAEANETFFRASDEELDQGAAYPFMTPIFGEGVVFDASPERRREMLHNQSLRDKYMRGHADTIVGEVDAMCAQLDDSGTIDLLEWTAELFIYTSSSCLVGRRFRAELTARVAHLFGDLEQGTDPIAFVDPYADIESFRRRDAARAELVDIIAAIMDRREAAGIAEGEDKDLLDVMMSVRDDDGAWRFDPDQVTGMFISMMFAGHHTTSTTASWTLIELLRHPEHMAAVVAEVDALFEAGGDVTYQALREIPLLEGAIKEALRLHPPLILLLRKVMTPFEVGGVEVPEGWLVGASPAVSNRLPESFENAEGYDPRRYVDPRHDDLDNPWNWIPFGAGRHRCVGAAFALMQLKAVFLVLLRDWTFGMAQDPSTYHNDHSKMVVQLAQPAAVTYRRRAVESP